MTGYMKNTTIKAWLLIYITFSTCSIASPMFPRGCEMTGYGFSQNDLVFTEHNHHAFFLMQNRSHDIIVLRHVETQPNVFMSPSLVAQINPGRWAAFASDATDLYFRCYRKVGNEHITIDCREALDICQYPRVKFALSNMGTYWVSTNKPQTQVIKESTTKGIYLHW